MNLLSKLVVSGLLCGLIGAHIGLSRKCTQPDPKLAKHIAELRAKHADILNSLGLPAFGDGIKVVPRSQLGLPDDILEIGAEEARQQAELGYVKKETTSPAELLDMKVMAPIDIRQYAANNNEKGTHLRQSTRQLKLAFKFRGVEGDDFLLHANNNIKVLGAAPQGAFHDEFDGWSGAAQFFSMKNLGVCSYAVMNVKASGTSAMLAMEDVTYDINSKATLIHTEGSKNSGFLYKVEWFDDENFHELECANAQYSKQIKHEVIELARMIDKS
jgi:hypothetical protein